MKKMITYLTISFFASAILAQTGNVGIGTTTPLKKLHVGGNLMLDGKTIYLGPSSTLYAGVSALYFDAQSSTSSQLIFRDFENDQYGRVVGSGNGNTFGLMDGDGNWIFQSSKDVFLGFRVNNLERIRLLANGNLGIGTTAPTQRLDVNGMARIRSLGAGAPGDQVLVVDNTGVIKKRIGGDESSTNELPIAGNDTDVSGNTVNVEPELDYVHTMNSPATTLKFGVGGLERMRITNTGRVGIGVTSPAVQLHINGNVRADGRRVNFGSTQQLYGDNGSALYWTSASASTSQIIFRGNNLAQYGRILGSASGLNFGLGDADGNFVFKSVHDQFLAMSVDNSEKVRILDNGNVGIGVTLPAERLHTAGNIRINGRTIFLGPSQTVFGDNVTAFYFDSNHSNQAQLILRDAENERYGHLHGSANGQNFGLLDGDGNWMLHSSLDQFIGFRINNSEKVRILTNGNVGIGTTTPNSKLSVNGKIRSKEVLIELVNWPDYVFKETYQLPSLMEEELFIEENGHLSGFDSEAEMEGEITVGDVTKRQQEKIEQMMLHLIDIKKDMDSMKSEIETLQVENKELKEQLKN